MNVDYGEIIREISEIYSKRGYYSLWKGTKGLENKIGRVSFEIVFEVVENGFLQKCFAKSSSRFFGAFPEEDIRNLTYKCENLEKELKNKQEKLD